MWVASDVVIPFGKYKGRTISYVYDVDDTYLRWIVRAFEDVYYEPEKRRLALVVRGLPRSEGRTMNSATCTKCGDSLSTTSFARRGRLVAWCFRCRAETYAITENDVVQMVNGPQAPDLSDETYEVS